MRRSKIIELVIGLVTILLIVLLFILIDLAGVVKSDTDFTIRFIITLLLLSVILFCFSSRSGNK